MINILLDENFFTALPAIILGMICFGIVMFLIFAIMSKIFGTSVGYRGGIAYKGGTLADPDTLDKIASEGRKLVDKKYKVKKKLEEECNNELNTVIPQIVSLIHQCFWMQQDIYRISDSFFMKPAEREILNLIGRTEIGYQSFKGEYQVPDNKLTSEDLKKIDSLVTLLMQKKEEITALITLKYEDKLKEMNKYL